jgi:transposase
MTTSTKPKTLEPCADPCSRGNGATKRVRASASSERGPRLGLPRPSPTHVRFRDRRYRLGQRANSKDTGRPLKLKEPAGWYDTRTYRTLPDKDANKYEAEVRQDRRECEQDLERNLLFHRIQDDYGEWTIGRIHEDTSGRDLWNDERPEWPVSGYWLVTDGWPSYEAIGQLAGSDAGVAWGSKSLGPQVEPLEGEQLAGAAEHFLRKEDPLYAESSKAWRHLKRGGGAYRVPREREILSSQIEDPELELDYETFLGLQGYASGDFADALIERLDRESEALSIPPPTPVWDEIIARENQIARNANKIHHLKARLAERERRAQDEELGRKFRRKLLRKLGLPTMTTREWERHLQRERKARQREERDRKIVAYWALGLSDRQIGEKTGYGRGTIYDVLKDAKNRTKKLANSEEAEVQTAEIIRQLAAEDERSFQTRRRLIEQLGAKHPDSEIVQSAVDRFNEIALDATEEIAA